MPSLFGWLENIPYWRDLPYPAKGALLRAFKAAAAILVSAGLAVVSGGLLFPATMNPMYVLVITTILTSILQGLDKYLRESAIEKEANESPVPLVDNAGPDEPDAPIVLDEHDDHLADPIEGDNPLP